MHVLGAGNVNLRRIAVEQGKALASIETLDPVRLAASIGSLLAAPELQANCIRLETLVHLVLLFARGRRKPTDKIVSRLFREFGKGWAGRLEDPSEDVFVTLIATARGNFRMLEGVWESAGFFTQRVVNVVEALPNAPQFNRMRQSIYALLRLSDAVCERAGLTRYQLGSATPHPTIPPRLLVDLRSAYRLLRFSPADLAELGINPDDLEPFGFVAAGRDRLLDDQVGNSSLERSPIIYYGDAFYLVLPSATSAAIRRYVIEAMTSLNIKEAFVSQLGLEYSKLMSSTPLLGGKPGAQVEFRRTSDGLLAGVTRAIDRGRYLNVVFFVDTLEEFENGGLIGLNPRTGQLAADCEHWFDEAYRVASESADFRGMLTLLVGCGVGRIVANVASIRDRDKWQLEFVSAADLITLSWLPDFRPLELWRLLDARDKLTQQGVTLHNINGLLNLVAWMRSLDGHLVPHSDMPNEVGRSDAPAFVMIDQAAIRNVRHDALVACDPHAALDINQKWARVRRDGGSFFEEDRNLPSYRPEEQPSPTSWSGVYETAIRSWWWESETPEASSPYESYERSQLVKVWICRIVPIVEAVLPSLPKGPILVRVSFEAPLGASAQQGRPDPVTYGTVHAAIDAIANHQTKIISIGVRKTFESALFHPENIAERALVARMVEGIFQLSNVHDVPITSIVDAIVPDASARHAHAFLTQGFRDFVRHSAPPEPASVEALDTATIKLGLGWRVRERKWGGELQEKRECTSFLNSVVRDLEEELCKDLRLFRRKDTIRWALLNHESAVNDRDRWLRTGAAVLSLHNDRDATLQTIAEQNAKLNAVCLCTRILVEAALCECPIDSGLQPGRLDLSKLTAKIMLIYAYGGWSDAIHWDAMPPRIRITPLGDIHAQQTFQEEVLAKFGRAGSDVQVKEGAENYAEYLKEPHTSVDGGSDIEPEFLEAWQEEFGATLDQVIQFIEFIEGIGLDQGRSVLSFPRSQLLALPSDYKLLNASVVSNILEALTLKTRPSWRSVPVGFDEKDRQPWRFRRRLSILRRPVLQIDDLTDPTLMVAPGILRDGLRYTGNQHRRGDFPLWQLKPKMKRWAGRSRDRIGNNFNALVAGRLTDLGWTTEIGVKITKLLRKGFAQDYGDVDVLAWDKTRKRVLIIECKDVQYRKTDGEIAEQLADFRGEYKADGKADVLKKHLLRLDVIGEHQRELGAYVGFDGFRSEGQLVFKNPVPMQFAWERMNSHIRLHIFDELDQI
jgi:hypothetical protein